MKCMGFSLFALLLLLFDVDPSWAKEFPVGKCQALVQGPYSTNIYPGAKLCFVKTGDPNAPIALVMDRLNNSALIEVDRYEVVGGDPEIESLFFYPVKGVENVFVLVSWSINSRGVGTYGKMYQVYAYYKNEEGGLKVNADVSTDPKMEGMDGYMQGVESFFEYKTAADIKKFIGTKKSGR